MADTVDPLDDAENGPSPDGGEADANDDEIADLQKKVMEMEEEAEKLKALTEGVDGDEGEDAGEVDKRSIYVGNVDYGSSPEELQEHFKSCGQINRITILVDKFTGLPKGFAYIEFAEEHTVNNAQLLNDSLFRGRQLKVVAKRTNIPGFNAKGKPKGKGKGKGKASKGTGGYGAWDTWSYGKGYGGKGKGKYGGKHGYSPY
jgi:polyadenylate-binding protein 2